MRDAPRYLGRAGDQVVRERLEQYQRYASLMVDQERALAAEDLDRFQELAVELEQLRAHIGSLDGGDASSMDESSRQELSETLEGAMDTSRRIQERLTALRSAGAAQIKQVGRRAPEARRYLSEPREAPLTRLDMKL